MTTALKIVHIFPGQARPSLFHDCQVLRSREQSRRSHKSARACSTCKLSEAWNRLRGFLDCLQDTAGGGRRSLCEMLIGDQCDCSGGSYVRPSTGGVQMKCIFKASSVFARGYGIRATGSVDSSGETTLDANVLPGEDFEQAHRMHNQALRLRETVRQNQRTMRNMQRDLARGRQGSLSELRPQKAGFAAELLGLPPPPGALKP